MQVEFGQDARKVTSRVSEGECFSLHGLGPWGPMPHSPSYPEQGRDEATTKVSVHVKAIQPHTLAQLCITCRPVGLRAMQLLHRRAVEVQQVQATERECREQERREPFPLALCPRLSSEPCFPQVRGIGAPSHLARTSHHAPAPFAFFLVRILINHLIMLTTAPPLQREGGQHTRAESGGE